MRDKELWLNGSGYPDPTAYKAMKGMVDMKGKVGEIWAVNTHKGTKRMLLLAERDGAYTMLEMFDEETSHTNLGVGGYYTNTICLTYGLQGRLKDKVDELDSDRFGDVLESIGCSLGIPMMPVTDFVNAAHNNTLEKNAEINRLQEKNAEYIETIQERNSEIEDLKNIINEKDRLIVEKHDAIDNLRGRIRELNKINEELVKECKDSNVNYLFERDLYKRLYEMAMDRLARKAVGEDAF